MIAAAPRVVALHDNTRTKDEAVKRLRAIIERIESGDTDLVIVTENNRREDVTRFSYAAVGDGPTRYKMMGLTADLQEWVSHGIDYE